MITTIIIIIIALIMLFILSCALANKIVSKKVYGRRGDASISIKYPLPSDYKNLNVRKDYFVNNKKARLTVYEYCKKNSKPKALILFCHGVGGGHIYSLPLINYFCENGYMVVAYDQYASGSSEGKRMESMTQGVADVKCAVKYVEEHYKDLSFYVAGHSWGGFCATQALRYSNRIEKCIDIAGLDSEAAMAKGKPFIRAIAKTFVKLCGATQYGIHSFYSSLGIMKKTRAKVLYLQGEDDLVVDPKYSGYMYQKKLKNKDNIKVVMLPKKGHAPMVTYKSQLKQSKVMAQFGMLGGVLVPLETYVDFNKNNVPDMDVYKLMLDFFDN